MERKSHGLLFKFGIIFFIFTIATVLMCGLNIYLNQTASYQKQCEENITHLADYLEKLIEADGEDFINYQNYLVAHRDEIDIPHDFSGDYMPEKRAFEELFAKKYLGKTMEEVTFEKMSEDLKIAYTKYRHEYWLNTFETATEQFGIAYTYYIIPAKEKERMIYVIDAYREERKVGDEVYIQLGLEADEPLEEHQKMWEAYNSGKKAEGYDSYDNEFGKTYAYYIPVIIQGKKLGVIGTEVEIADVNHEIIQNTMRQISGMAAILVVAVLAMLWLLNQRYISKLSNLQFNVKEYAKEKDASIAGVIESSAVGGDEIATLSMQVAAMIMELEEHMKDLVKTTKQLNSTQKLADEMNELAHKDALTSVRNKTAYDKEIQALEWKLEEGETKFGIGMVDLNFLKRINDTYGHEKGNIAIKKICYIVCHVFEHCPVFRIGGDEFAIIIRGTDYDHIEDLVNEFNRQLDEIAQDESLEFWERVSAAIGYALFDPDVDSSVDNVFKRADKAMYKRKMEMKAVRLD